MGRTTLLTGAAIMAITCGFAYYLLVPRVPAVQVAAVEKQAHVRPQRKVKLAYVSHPDPTRPDLTIAASTSAAQAGSPAAMLDLSRALRLCAALKTSSEQSIIRKQVQIAEGNKGMARDLGLPFDAKQHEQELESKTRTELEVKSVCDNISASDASKWIDWLERAAAAGDENARREFAQAVISSMSDTSGALADIEEIARRKKVAYRFLDDVLNHGDCTVSTHMELLAPSPVELYAAAVISFSWGRDLQPSIASPAVAAENIAFMQRRLDEQATRLRPEQLTQANAMAAQGYQACSRR